MERTMSVEEKIRRAEEIYNRRNGNSYYTYSKPKEKKGPTFTQRMVKQIIICFIIYGIFYVVNNREYFLSNEFRMKVEEVASQNEYLNKAYNYMEEHLGKYFNINTENEAITNEENTSNENNMSSEENANEIKEETTASEATEENSSENIGGAEEQTISENEKTQEEQDVEYIKNNISFILPIEGRISSSFGWRNPTTPTVPKYHTGLDIAVNQGTVIKSATDGTVILASSQGDYGNHYKIEINGIILIYAHCKKLYLKEGDKVTQGQEIAEVGSTGNSTRTAFTF